jgi:hypothetical protein
MIMADFTIETTTIKKTPLFQKWFTLTAGQKLSDNAEVLALAQKTVPKGYKANVHILIEATLEEV